MALVPHASSSSQDGNKGAIVAIRGAQELTQEEYEQRIKDVRNPHLGNIAQILHVPSQFDATSIAARLRCLRKSSNSSQRKSQLAS